MPQQNYIGDNGIVTQTLPEILDDLKGQFLTIYPTANLEQNTADGQWLNILAQEKKDILDFITAIYNNLDTDTVTGIPQQVLYKLNGLEIKTYGYSYVYVDVTVNSAVTLQGLDANINNADGTGFTVTDNSGNRWILADSQAITAPGTYTFNFRAANLGEVISAINTITIMETIIPGVTGVNNTAPNYITGGTGESASQYRTRREKSVTMPSQGFADSIEAQLLTFTDIAEAKVYDNKTNSTDANGIPAHGVWVIVRGGTEEEIGAVIYNNIPPGIAMKGTETATVVRANGSNATVYYDIAKTTPLYIQMNIKAISGSIDQDYVKSQLEKIDFNIGQTAESVNIAVVAKDAVGDVGTPYDVEVSAGGSASATVSGSGVTAATVEVKKFVTAFTGATLPASTNYVFTYTSGQWKYNGDEVDLSDYGISVTGTAVNGDTVTVAYTNDYSEIATPSGLDEYFTISATNVSITVV